MQFKICCCRRDKPDKPNEGDNELREIASPITRQPIPSVTGSLTSFEQQCLEEHNRLRAMHGCPPLQLNPDLCAYAAEWAQTLADRNMLLEYRSEARYGENLFVARNYAVDAKLVVKSWYDEVWLYDFSKPSYTYGAENFTQMVWKSTTQMGVGVRKRESNTWIVVNYEPKGNVLGKFEENIPKLL